MNASTRIIGAVIAALSLLHARFAVGHGAPITLQSTGISLTAISSVADSEGFAPQIAVQDGEIGNSFLTTSLPSVGPVVIWQMPALTVSGLTGSSLSIEAISRLVKDSNPLEQRLLWYWDPLTSSVEPSTTDLYLLGTGGRFATVSHTDPNPTAPFLLTGTVSGALVDNHSLLSYALDNDPSPGPTAPHGAYGFFARFVSNQASPALTSNPVLIMFDHGVDDELMTTAALAINEAADDADTMPGDYNIDGTVDAADYVVWRKTMNTTPDYETWRASYGSTVGAGGVTSSSGDSASVPEPALGPLLAWIVASTFAATCLRTRNSRRSPLNAAIA
jgi:hypothetical protein